MARRPAVIMDEPELGRQAAKSKATQDKIINAVIALIRERLLDVVEIEPSEGLQCGVRLRCTPRAIGINAQPHPRPESLARSAHTSDACPGLIASSRASTGTTSSPSAWMK